MAKIDQLEIIAPDGKIYFHGLDPQKGVTNIGRHADNDIVIDSPSIGQFQAVLDHQKKPFRFMVISKEGRARLAGQPLVPDVFQEIHDWQTVDLDGFSLTLLENMDVGEGTLAEAGTMPVVVSAGAAPPIPAAAPAAVPAESLPVSVSTIFPTRPADSLDDTIVADIAEREQTVDVEQPASFEITVANGGPIVAEFGVMVEGIDPAWVTIVPPQIFLNEGSRANARITILPPRSTTTTAGVHHLAFAITSPNYPGHLVRLGASLVINPYFEFTVGNLSPSQQSASWSQRSATASFPIHNQGNSLATFQTIAQDDENGCRFEYQQEEQANLARQVEVKVKPGETVTLPITITPLKRSLVRVRARQYHYSVTTQSLSDPGAARVLAGTFTSRPLFGPFSILAAAVLLLVGIFFMFRPRLDAFTVTPSVVSLGQPVTLSWQAPLFTNELTLKDLPDAIKAGQNQVSITPTDTLTTYTLIGRNWLSRLLSLPDVTLTSQSVLAIPPTPQITTFSVDKTDVILGQPVTVKWAVSNATSVTLTVENVPTTLAPADFSGEKTITLNNNSLIVLEARNASGSVVQSEYVRVWGPSDLKVDFTVDPPEVTAGNPVNVNWNVSGSGFTVDTVTVAPFNEPLPAQFSLKYYPTESMYFVLKVKVQDYELSVPKYVTVLPADAKPVIDYFKATPPNLTSSGSVEFSWSVSGPTDSIEISNKNGVVQGSLPPQGFANITVTESATYVLTAKKGNESSAAVVEIQVNNLADVNVSILSMVPQSGILRGDSVFVYFSVTPKVVVVNGPEISGSVVITDGFDSCEVQLPITSCELVFHRSGTDKKITATYSGDSNYRRTTSAPFPTDTYISVIGSTVTLQNIAINYIPPVPDIHPAQADTKAVNADPVVGQTGYLQFDVVPVGGQGLTPVQGLFDVLVIDSGNVTTTLCINQKLSLAINPEGANVGRGYCGFTFGSVGKKTFIVKYRGNEIYEPLNSDPNDPNQSGLIVNVTKAPTRINLLVQNPSGSAQIGQQVSLTLQVVVDAQGGIPVPGVGKITIKDSPSHEVCSATVNDQGIATCVFTPTQAISELIIGYTGDGVNYGDADNTGTNPIHYEITKALVDVLVTAVNPSQVNPMVGQTVTAVLQVQTTAFNVPANTGTVQVFLQDAANPTPTTPKCTITLPQTPLQCNILVEHSGTNTILTAYTDSANNYQVNTLGTKAFTVNPATVTIQNITPSAPSTVEGSQVSVSFNVVPSFATTLVPRGGFTIYTDGGEAPCSGTRPAQTSCNLTILASSSATRNIAVIFGDGVDYVPTSAILSNYPILHRTTTTINSNSPNPPQAFGSTTVFFNVAPYYSAVPGIPIPVGNVTVAVVGGSSTCTGSLDASGNGSCLLPNLQAGASILRATFHPQNAPFATSTSADYPLSVIKVDTSFSLQTPIPGTSYLRDTVSFTLAYNGSGTIPTGTAVISAQNSDGSQAVCQNVVQLVNGQGACSITFNTAGTWDLYYTYSGDSSYNPITTPQSLNASHLVVKYPTMVVITGFNQRHNSTQGTITYEVTKQLVNGVTLPDAITGMVTINITGSSPLLTCTGPINYNSNSGVGTGSCPIQFPTGGGTDYEAVASYSGDDNFDVSTSLSFTITVQ
jgi:hypothetical protein